MRIAGIDLSTHAVDIVTIDVEERDPPEWRRFPLEGADSFTRARQVRDAMPARTDEWYDDVLAVGIEDPAGHHGTNHIYRIQGCVLACLPKLVLVQQWRPAAWKKAVGLKGNATKIDVTTFVTGGKGWPAHMQDWTYDACDACCVALATRAVLRTGQAAA